MRATVISTDHCTDPSWSTEIAIVGVRMTISRRMTHALKCVICTMATRNCKERSGTVKRVYVGRLYGLFRDLQLRSRNATRSRLVARLLLLSTAVSMVPAQTQPSRHTPAKKSENGEEAEGFRRQKKKKKKAPSRTPRTCTRCSSTCTLTPASRRTKAMTHEPCRCRS